MRARVTNVLNRSGNTPLHEAVSMGASRKAVIQSLLRYTMCNCYTV